MVFISDSITGVRFQDGQIGLDAFGIDHGSVGAKQLFEEIDGSAQNDDVCAGADGLLYKVCVFGIFGVSAEDDNCLVLWIVPGI